MLQDRHFITSKTQKSLCASNQSIMAEILVLFFFWGGYLCDLTELTKTQPQLVCGSKLYVGPHFLLLESSKGVHNTFALWKLWAYLEKKNETGLKTYFLMKRSASSFLLTYPLGIRTKPP